MKKGRSGVIENIKEKFVALSQKRVDSKGRITLGAKILKLVKSHSGTDEFQIFYGDNGDILLRPVVSIPTNEAWIYRNPKVIKAIRKGLAEAEQGELERVEDLDAFIDSL